MSNIYFASGVRTPFSKIDGALASYDAIELSIPVVQGMAARLKAGMRPDIAVWGCSKSWPKQYCTRDLARCKG